MLPLSLLLSYRQSRAIRDHKKKSTYHVCWEYSHKVFGIFTILMGFLQVTLGLFLIIAKEREGERGGEGGRRDETTSVSPKTYEEYKILHTVCTHMNVSTAEK